MSDGSFVYYVIIFFAVIDLTGYAVYLSFLSYCLKTLYNI